MRTTRHRHRAERSTERCYSGPIVGADENRAAHGNICRTERCGCGAERRSNVNGRHVECGPWQEAES